MRTNKVKVIKPIKGLEVGDILTYNNEEYTFELTKEISDITDTTLNKSKYKYSFGAYTIKNNEKYFQFLDDDNTPITLIDNDDIYEYTTELHTPSKKIDECIEPKISVDVTEDIGKKMIELCKEKDSLQKEVDELKFKLENIVNTITTNKYITFNPFMKYFI